jgi:hypothetical protein
MHVGCRTAARRLLAIAMSAHAAATVGTCIWAAERRAARCICIKTELVLRPTAQATIKSSQRASILRTTTTTSCCGSR